MFRYSASINNKLQGDETNQVDIILATYNGRKYLPDLLNSIINQTYQNWKLIIRDDGSTDDTMEIVYKHIQQYPEKIIHIDGYSNLGPMHSFSKLMEYSTADYIMFCDQDDVWLNNKIELTLEKMIQMEEEYPNIPLLVHTDLTVVDKDLQVISKSFWEYQRLNPNLASLNHLLSQNMVTGCTMMINRRLKELASPVPHKAIMHDWWIALVASIYSGVYYINEPTILYRQHGENSVGAKRYSLNYFISRLGKAQESIQRTIKQGEELKLKFWPKLNQKQRGILNSYIQILRKNRLSRMCDLFTYRFRKHGFLRNIGFIISIIILKGVKKLN